MIGRVLSIAVAALTLGCCKADEHIDRPCEDASTGAERLGCFLAAAAKSRAEVDIEFEQDLRTAAEQDREASSLGSSLVEQLKASQAAWLEFSEAQCSFEGESSHGGSGTDILQAACHQRMNLQRLVELEAANALLKR